MKTNSTLIIVIRIVAFILLCLYSLLVFGQTDYTAKSNKTLLIDGHSHEASYLSAFEGSDEGDKIRLHWILADENKAGSVLIEKSFDKDNFQYVADFWVNLDGNTVKNFRYADPNKGNKTIYYRLKITGTSGRVHYSDIIAFAAKSSKK